MMTELEIPVEVPVMTLNKTVLFPQAMLPLYIFEPRYRQMLADVLPAARIFAVASVKSDEEEAELLETPCTVAGIGVVRAQQRLGAPIPGEFIQFLGKITDPESVLDLSIFTLCSSSRLQQQLLETRGILARFHLFERFLVAQIQQLKLDRMLQGGLDDEQIGNN